jgi:hypothetical protein
MVVAKWKNTEYEGVEAIVSLEPPSSYIEWINHIPTTKLQALAAARIYSDEQAGSCCRKKP